MRTSRPGSRLLAASGTVLLLSLTACGGGSDHGGSTADALTAAGGAAGAQREEAATVPAPQAADAGAAKNAALLVEQQAVIKNGAVSLRSDDVGKTRFDVQELVDQHNGQVSEDKTETDKTGQPLRSRMVIRVPSEDFDDVMGSLSKMAQLAALTSSAEDVTTQVIDVEARIAVQQRSVDRVSDLLARAQSIRDIMRIEAELSRRQADLDSLKQQQAYLADQTTLATIRVSIERKADAIPVQREDHTGFLAGLESGWHGLAATVVAVLTIVGAVLPFALVALLFGVPVWLLLRRSRRPSEPTPATPGDVS